MGILYFRGFPHSRINVNLLLMDYQFRMLRFYLFDSGQALVIYFIGFVLLILAIKYDFWRNEVPNNNSMVVCPNNSCKLYYVIDQGSVVGNGTSISRGEKPENKFAATVGKLSVAIQALFIMIFAKRNLSLI